MTVSFTVAGTPVTQGSKKGFVVNGRAVLVDQQHRALRDWRGLIAAQAQFAGQGTFLTGPVHVTAHFRLRKPASAPKRKRIWPTGARTGDLDKLTRALFDALTGVLWRDDGQVVDLLVTKDYADGPCGVDVFVSEVTR